MATDQVSSRSVGLGVVEDFSPSSRRALRRHAPSTYGAVDSAPRCHRGTSRRLAPSCRPRRSDSPCSDDASRHRLRKHPAVARHLHRLLGHRLQHVVARLSVVGPRDVIGGRRRSDSIQSGRCLLDVASTSVRIGLRRLGLSSLVMLIASRVCRPSRSFWTRRSRAISSMPLDARRVATSTSRSCEDQHVLVLPSEIVGVVLATALPDDDLPTKFVVAEDLVAELRRFAMLVVVDRDDDHAVVGQQVPRELQPRVHHAEPVGVEATVRLGVRDEPVARPRRLWPERREVLRRRLGEVVVVDEVVARVVRRVDVDELDLAEVRLLEQLQRVEVVALDEEVLRGVEVDGLLADRAERLGDRRVGGERAARLPGQSSW